MRPTISWADLPGRRVGVWGPAGVEGQANLRKLAALGIVPAVLVDDSPPQTPPTPTTAETPPATSTPATPVAPASRPSGAVGTTEVAGTAEAVRRAAAWPAVLATADGGLEALASCDVVIKAPGISRYREDARWLADRGVTVAGGLGLWLAGL